MRAVSTILMVSLLLIQALSGWCWHAARDRTGLETSVATVKSCDGDCEDASEEEPSQDPCKCRLECSGICTFVPPEKTLADAPQLVVGFDHLAIYPVLAGSQAVIGFWTEVARGPSDLERPLRLHLLHQILLI